MDQNIFQVINENDLDEILSNHIRDLVVIMLSSQTCAPCKVIKPKFVGLSQQHKDVFFVYIDRSSYTITGNKYFTEFEYTPTFVFYFGGNKIAFVEGGHEPSLVQAITVLKQKIAEKKKEFEQQEKLLAQQKMNELEAISLLNKMQNNNNNQNKITTPNNTEEENKNVNNKQVTEEMIMLNKKMEILQKLRELNNIGIKLTKNYNLDSSIEEMMFEYQFQSNPQFRQQILQQQASVEQPPPVQQQSPPPPVQKQSDEETVENNSQQEELAKKREQVRQIQELDMLNKKMQAQSFQKLQQLRRIQQMKEQQEKNNEKQ